MTILVTGATGTVGGELVAQLRAAGHPLRAMTRDPARANLGDGVEVVAGDLGRPDTLTAALSGVDSVFLLSLGGEVPEHTANLLAAARGTGVRRIVKLSVFETESDTDDVITASHRAADELVKASGLEWTLLGPGMFMSNTRWWAGSINATGTVFAPYGTGYFPVIDPADIAAVAAVALTEDGHHGASYRLTGPEALRLGDMVRTLSTVLGRELRYVDVPVPAARQAMIDNGMAAPIADAVLAVQSLSLRPDAHEVLPTVEKVTGRPAGTFEQWARRHRDAFTA